MHFAMTGRLAWRGTPTLDFLQSFGHSANIIIPVHIQALRQSISILTPVFLGFAIQNFFSKNTGSRRADNDLSSDLLSAHGFHHVIRRYRVYGVVDLDAKISGNLY